MLRRAAERGEPHAQLGTVVGDRGGIGLSVVERLQCRLQQAEPKLVDEPRQRRHHRGGDTARERGSGKRYLLMAAGGQQPGERGGVDAGALLLSKPPRHVALQGSSNSSLLFTPSTHHDQPSRGTSMANSVLGRLQVDTESLVITGPCRGWVFVERKLTGQVGFVVLHRRWCVERTFSWINRCRRTVRDYQRLPAHHAAMVQWAMITIMARRLGRYHATRRALPWPTNAR
ncbi:transposase [Micromonospora sp. NPDC006431]|uniref:transposase n=1 Tax=Micromonospora sp. NPDC006431 TaxID=3364235 RepID=UPI0036C9E71E